MCIKSKTHRWCLKLLYTDLGPAQLFLKIVSEKYKFLSQISLFFRKLGCVGKLRCSAIWNIPCWDQKVNNGWDILDWVFQGPEWGPHFDSSRYYTISLEPLYKCMIFHEVATNFEVTVLSQFWSLWWVLGLKIILRHCSNTYEYPQDIYQNWVFVSFLSFS